MATGFPGFPAETLKFLRQLRRNNNREWFLAHKQFYEQYVKTPMTELVIALGNAIQVFAPEMAVDPKRAIYRFYRDTRFSSDKTPYKTHLAAIFGPRGLPKHSGAAFYFEISPEEVLVAGGVYMPGTEELHAIRTHLAGHAEEFRKIISNREFRKRFGGLEGEKLVRTPKDYPPDHPAIDLLRYKQFLVSAVEPARMAERPQLFSRLLSSFALMAPLVQFLNFPLRVRAKAPEDF